jgi:filamentous hemagglutinin family protein
MSDRGNKKGYVKFRRSKSSLLEHQNIPETPMNKHLRSLFTATLLFLPSIAHAQTYQPTNRTPVADNTLGTQVSGTNNNFDITGGLNRGQNLFHSFTDFSIPTGGSANFTNPAGNRAIITRVTGNLFSDLNGLVNTNGANFLLINPNGVVFGTNARLNVGKAFVTSTANAIDFVDAAGRTFTFGVNRAGDAPLLSIDPNVAFNPARLIMGGTIPGSKGIENYGTLKTNNPGQYIGLIGGNVSFNGGNIDAPGGRVELWGLSVPGTIGLGVEGDLLRAEFPTNVTRGDVSFTNQSKVVVAGAGGGDVSITARNLEILGASEFRGGIEENLGTPTSVAGDIKVNATGEIAIVGSKTGIRNNVNLNAQGNGGNIVINAGSFSLRDGAQLQAITYGRGNAGNVTVTAKDTVSLTGGIVFSTVQAGGVGKGGNITIDAGLVSLRDGARLVASTSGQGNAGNVTVKSNAVSLVDASMLSNVEAGGVGKGGNITIDAGTLSLQDSAQLLTIVRGASATQPAGKGDAGNVIVTVSGAVDIAATKDGLSSGIFSYVDTGAEGNGGNITIDAGSFSLRDGAGFQSSILGTGNAGNVTVTVKDAVSLAGSSYITSTVGLGGVGNGGNITINAGALSFSDGAQLIASTFGRGNAGNVTVTAKDAVSLADADIFSTISAGGVGKGGIITINAGSLSLRDGSQLVTGTIGASDTQPAGKGDAGNVNVKVSGAVNIGGKKDGVTSAIFSIVEAGAEGNGGNITIDAGSLLLRDGAQLAASTSGIGNAGNVMVTAKDAVSLNNASIFSDVNAGGVGKGGNISIDAGSLSIQDGAQLLTITRGASDTQPAGKGDAGNVIVTVSGAVDIAGIKNGFSSGIRSLVNTGTVGNGGNITIDAGSFSLRDGAELTASTFGTGNAGNVTVTAKDAVSLVNANIFSDVNAGGVGKGGNITIDAGSFSLRDGAQLLTSTRKASNTQPAGKGDAGNVIVTVSGAVDIAGSKDGLPSAIFSSVDLGTVGNGGNITIDAGSFSLRDGAKIESSTLGTGNAGNIGIKAKGDITLAGTATFVNNQPTNISKSAIVSSSLGVGDAGKISIDNPSGKLSVSFSNIQTTIGDSENKNATGISQGISINARELEIKNNSVIVSDLFGKGQAGNIDVKTTGDITISGNNQDPLKVTPFNLSTISSTTRGIGDGGKISIETPGKLSLDSTGFIISGVDKDAQGKSQGIKINVGELNLTDFGGISSDTLGKNPGGDIDIVAKGSVNIKKSTIQASSNKVTSTLNVPGGNDIPVTATGEGKAGNISISSDRLNIDGGIIFSIASSDSGGNITLTVRDLLLLRNDSNISTTSGLDNTGGNGGNIIINSPLIVALPAGNGGGNDIAANAFTGNGGKVNITSQGLFGIQFRPKSSPSTNDITASSTLGQNGTVNISTPGTDPGRDSTELPNTTTDASNQISQVCSANNRQNKLTVTGRGGLPPNANDPLTSDVVWQDARAVSSQPAVSNATNNSATLPPPAVGWVFDGKGKVTLVAAGTPGQPTGTRVVCPISNK